MARFTFDPEKQHANIRKHGYDFSFAEPVFLDPLSVTIYDRFEGGEHRWHTIGAVGGGFKVLLVVHSFPDAQDDEWVHVIGLREADRLERKRYEAGHG
jgi:uncharacterized DUF497 family protein